MERKCTSCGTWNSDEDFCTNCGSPISLKELKKLERQRQEKRLEEGKKTKVDLMLARMKSSPNLFVRLTYRVLYSVWVVYMAIATAILWFIALGPG